MEDMTLSLTVAPVSYWWDRPTLMHFYAEIADSPARTVVLGEVVCSRRNDYSLADWLDLARDLTQAGKQVRLASLPLVMSEAELRSVRKLVEQADLAVEAGDASALQLLAGTPQRPPCTLGPHLNIYSRDALQEHAALNADVWVAAAELSLDAIARINPPADPVPSAGRPLRTEVQAFGRLALAFSARCFTARHHRLSKDDCDFRCRQDADGLLLSSTEGQPFLVLNGIQTQSAGLHCLINQGAAVRAAGVSQLRLSPCSQDFGAVLTVFDQVFNQGLDAQQGLQHLRTLRLPGRLEDGYARRQPGMAEVAL
jgi:O2-independent ubiquinone biosynthesis protein UbiV